MRTINPALWINYETADFKGSQAHYGNPCPYFRKEFSLKDKKVVSAILQASAVGVFKAYINGAPVDDDYMSPGWTDYRKRIPLLEFDVLDKIQTNNALMIVAGDGWAVGYMGNRMYRNNYAKKIRVIAKLTVTYEDGEKQEIITDDSWKAKDGEIRRTDNYLGEVVDHRYAFPKEAYTFGYDDSDWKPLTPSFNPIEDTQQFRYGLLSKELAPRTKVMHVLPGEKIYDDGRMMIYDFKKNMVGVIRIKVRGERNTKLTIRHGEMLEHSGLLYTENLRKAEATDTFILSGAGEEEFRPLFTFHGFRYAEIVVTGQVEILEINGEVMYSALPKVGEWECSDPDVNKLYENIVWGQRGNFLSVPTDCPQRDERLGWTGDAQIFCGTAMYNMDCEGFYAKYIQDLIDSQLGDGGIAGVVPHIPHPDLDDLECHTISAAGWADAMTVIPYEYYVNYGNKKLMRYHLVFAKQYVRFLVMQSDDLIRPRDPNWGDWLNANCDTDKSLLSTAYFAFSARLTAKLCDVAGDEDAEEFYALYEDVKSAFRNKFITAEGKLSCHTQTAYLLAYSFGLMTADEVKENLLDTIHAVNDKLTTGFLGVKFLLPTLCELGEVELAYKILTNREYPGWLYSVVNGATTIWERWNGYTIEHGFGDVGMNSFNHYSLGSCGEWMFRYCLGFVPDVNSAGYKKLTLKPYVDFSGKLTYAKGSYDSKMGKIYAEWEVKEGKAIYKARIPEAIDLTVCVPDGVEAIIERY